MLEIMFMFRRLTLLALLAALLPGPAAASDERAAMSALLDLLPGTFDSLAQKEEDEAEGLTGEMVHGWVNRAFTPVYAPDIGIHVLVAAVSYNGPDGIFDKGEFQVWTLAPNADGSVTMSPRGFKDIEAFIPISRDAAALSRLTPDDLVPPKGAAGCPITWRLEDGVLKGSTDPATCVNMSSTLGIPLAWEWRYEVTPDAMWITYAGRNEAGEIANGREDQVPWRLDRVM